MTIQGWPDTESPPNSDGIFCIASGSDDKWAGHVYLAKNGDLHQHLVSTEAVFASKADAVTKAKDLVKQIRALDLMPEEN